MKKYDSIWIKSDEFPEPNAEGFFSSIPVLKCQQGPLICMTIEEALEMWNAGRHRQSDEFKSENLSKVTSPDFYNYLKSKGIDPTK